MQQTQQYQNPLAGRYASPEMLCVFSDEKKFKTWRALWIALAQAEKELGLPITEQQIKEMRAYQDDINYQRAQEIEGEVRHDVMSHVHAFGEQCPSARPIIHLGATSCYVGDNTDIIVMREALSLVEQKLVNVLRALSGFAMQYKDMPTLGFTHFQSAQLTTVGKRACLWMQELLLDADMLSHVYTGLKLRGVKGTTGTQASFLTLFDGDHGKVRALEKRVCELMGFQSAYAVTGQTYSRKVDDQVLNVLSGVAQSAYKFGNDIRLLQNLKEMEEPFAKKQIGSSAMAYKRNPMRTERMCSLARYVISLPMNTAITSSTQWLERTLDDSANRRLSIPQAFLGVDAILNLYLNVTDGLVVYPAMIQKHIEEELPFMATETILMEAVKKGGDRQYLHERIRTHSMEAAKAVKMDGQANPLLTYILNDEAFGLTQAKIQSLVDARGFVGRAPEQVEEFVNGPVKEYLAAHADVPDLQGDIKV